MKISLNWIKKYMSDFPVNNLAQLKRFCNLLTLKSTEIRKAGYQIQSSTKLFVGQIRTIKPLKNSKHLKVTFVNVGEKNYQIITGAPNVKRGQLVVVALPGASLPNNKKIKSVKLDGKLSQGMLVSLQEIGFDDSIAPKKHEEGIYVFPNGSQTKPGDDANEALGINDLMIDTDLTPNRGDMLSIRGNLYEFSALLNKKFKKPTFKLQEGKRKISEQVSLHVNSQLAYPYYLRIVNNISVCESPLWLQKRLWNSGIRPINNIVDATNYVMLLFGQPFHAFNLDSLNRKQIEVSLAKNNDPIKLINGQSINLKKNEDIVIYDSKEPLMLAGVMGGYYSEVNKQTKNIVLEAACFNPSLIGKTARRYNLHSEASQRFERGLDLNTISYSLDYLASLIKKIAGGNIAQGKLSNVKSDNKPLVDSKNISITASKINQSLGTHFLKQKMSDIWKRLSFKYTFKNNSFIVEVPSRRMDINIDADLIEEFARIVGYNKIPAKLPQSISYNSGLNGQQKLGRSIRNVLFGLGLDQVISYSLTNRKRSTMFSFEKNFSIPLAHPLSKDHSFLRQSVLSTLTKIAAYNIARKNNNIHLFEMGKIFYSSEPKNFNHLIEKKQLAGLVSGPQLKNWQSGNYQYDFYYLKGIVEKFLDVLDFKLPITFKASSSHLQMHPGRTADIYIGEHFLGFLGEVNPRTVQTLNLGDLNTYVFQLDLDLIYRLYQKNINYRPLDRYPGISRDLSLLVDQNIPVADISKIITQNGGNFLREINITDLYQGKNIVEGKKSILYHLSFVNPNSSLTDREINFQVDRISKVLNDRLGIKLR